MTELRTLTQQGLQLGKVSKSFRVAGFVVHVALFILSFFCMSIVPFLRRNFGERYLSWGNLYAGYSVVWIFCFLGAFVPFGNSPGEHAIPFVRFAMSLPMLACYVAFILLSLWHRFEIWVRNYDGIEWHSFNMGESWVAGLTWLFDDAEKGIKNEPLSEEVTHKWAEPILVLVIGGILLKFCTPIGIWLVISGLALGIHSHIIYHQQRQRFLDTLDAQIEAKHLSGAIAGQGAAKTAGFVIAESNVRMVANHPSLKEAFASLSPELRRMVA